MSDGWTDFYWLTADGLRLHARDYAAVGGETKRPVVCIHGLTRNARDFEALCPRIAAGGRRVLAIDVRGRGGSANDPASDYRIPTYVADVARLFAEAGIGAAVFVGTSMGGLITMETAFQHPKLVSAAIINDIGPEIAVAGLARIAGYVGKTGAFPSWEEAATAYAALHAPAFPLYREADWVAAMHRQCRLDPDGMIRPDYDPNIALPFADEPLQIDPWERWDALATGRHILLLRGTLTDLLDADVAERMVIPHENAELVAVPDVGHAPMLDEPAAITAIESFLNRVD